MIITTHHDSPTPRTFTTFEVGKICGVFHTTVINWVNKGKLKAHSTPGGHRRITLSDLLEFMRKFEMPIPQDLTRRPKRILIVEDDPIVRRLLLRTFGNTEGLDIKTCESGLEAMIAIGKEAPDLLILDINIPQVNGLEVCRLLKANAHTTPIKIISISGQTLTESEQEFLHIHADCFFPKPLTPELLRIKALTLLDMGKTTMKEGSPSTS